LGIALMILAAAVRILVNQFFGALIIGSILAGASKPFIINTQDLLVKNWFSTEERPFIISLLFFGVNASIILGSLVPGLFFKGITLESTDSQIQSRTFSLILLELIIIFSATIPAFIFLRNFPP
jgi:hypothetical protein